MVFLFAWLLEVNGGQRRELRHLFALVYLRHPGRIVLVRGATGSLDWECWMVENSLIHFTDAVLLTLVLSGLILTLRPRPMARV